ncbi:hypothetical protein OTB20_36145 [Streptomyces sp. H27-H1]|uniref:hypothetical protein n=1 Tax=Streptomyces sp. H27-H1 TaxID=2996461 RepID=UPI00226D5100|nr:hypothetical protein [Streptomyces sp. H27-H1]MCY0931524.1 hypothetical protein [Streptomyces sp. H27-H1]
MPSPNISSFSTDQALAAGSLLRSLTLRLHSLPQPEAEALTQSLLAPSGLVNDIARLLDAANTYADATTPSSRAPLLGLCHHRADVAQPSEARLPQGGRLPGQPSSPGPRNPRGLSNPMASVAPE